MAIFALIAVIVVSGIGAYRVRAYQQGALSDANAIAMAAEADSDKGYPTTLDAATLAALGITLSPGNTIGGYAADSNSFALCVEHSSGGKDAYAVYDSAMGGIVDQGKTNGCAGITLDASAAGSSGGGIKPLPFIVPGPAGSLVAWGMNDFGQGSVPASAATSISRVAVGFRHSVAVKTDGTVRAWGEAVNGATSVPAGLDHVIAVSAGRFHSVALKSDGSVVAWGKTDLNQAVVPPGLAGVTQISAGYNHTLALKSDGTVVAWGDNASGQTNVPPGLTGVKYVSAGSFFSVAVKNDGTVVVWGSPPGAMPGGLTGVTQVAAGAFHILALKSDGTVVAWGGNGSGQTSVPGGLTGVVQVAVGRDFSLALKSNGTVVAWGDNTNGATTIPGAATNLLGLASSAAALHVLAISGN